MPTTMYNVHIQYCVMQLYKWLIQIRKIIQGSMYINVHANIYINIFTLIYKIYDISSPYEFIIKLTLTCKGSKTFDNDFLRLLSRIFTFIILKTKSFPLIRKFLVYFVDLHKYFSIFLFEKKWFVNKK